MAGITLSGVCKRYGDHAEVIRNVDLDIAQGEFCVFVGPSGCGKSTLLRMIAGLEDISAGELRIGGQVMNHVASAQRGVAGEGWGGGEPPLSRCEHASGLATERAR